MENKEFNYKGAVLNGFLALLFVIILFALAIFFFIKADKQGSYAIAGVAFMVLFAICMNGFVKLEPNEAVVLLFFGKYKGTFTHTGFYWVNPLMTKKSVSLRARNLNPEPIKVNDKVGNPVLIGMVLVWKLQDTYKALFEIDSQSLAPAGSKGVSARFLQQAFENFVRVQSDAALRQVAGCYAYDNADTADELTLRSNSDEINEELVRTLNDRLSMAGLHVTEARIREKIVDGAVSMVKMALDKLKAEGVVDLDEERKAAMVSNLLVVLCGDEPAQPVVNSGSLY